MMPVAATTIAASGPCHRKGSLTTPAKAESHVRSFSQAACGYCKLLHRLGAGWCFELQGTGHLAMTEWAAVSLL